MKKYKNKENGFVVEAEDYGTKNPQMLVQYDEKLCSDAEDYQNIGITSFLISKNDFENRYEELEDDKDKCNQIFEGKR